MSLRRGPFTIEWGENSATDVEAIDWNFNQDSEDFKTLEGRTRTIDGNQMVSATITLLGPSIALLASLLPQYYVANGEVLSTGETVNDASGAIDIKPQACDDALIYNDFDVIDCGNPSVVARIVHARTQFEGIEFSEKLSKVKIKIIGEADVDEATMQIFTEDTIAVVS